MPFLQIICINSSGWSHRAFSKVFKYYFLDAKEFIFLSRTFCGVIFLKCEFHLLDLSLFFPPHSRMRFFSTEAGILYLLFILSRSRKSVPFVSNIIPNHYRVCTTLLPCNIKLVFLIKVCVKMSDFSRKFYNITKDKSELQWHPGHTNIF